MQRRLSLGLVLCFGTTLGCGDDTGSGGTTSPEAGVDAGDETSPTGDSSTTSTASTGSTSSGATTDSSDYTTEADAGDGGLDIVWGDGGSLSISSPNFDDGDALPDAYTCEGEEFGSGVAPELNWSGPAAGTKRYALVFVDISLVDVMPTRAYHWVAYDIPVSVTGIPEELGGDPTPVELGGGKQVRGGPPQEDQNFFGPCPSWPLAVCPEGLVQRTTDEYNFILYTFDDDTLDYPEVAAQDKSYPQTLAEFFEENATERAILSATSDAASTTAPAPCPVEIPTDAGSDAGEDAGAEGSDAGDAGSNTDAGDAGSDAGDAATVGVDAGDGG